MIELTKKDIEVFNAIKEAVEPTHEINRFEISPNLDGKKRIEITIEERET